MPHSSPQFVKDFRFLILVIGNSRSHFGYFAGEKLVKTWDTEHISQPVTAIPRELLPLGIPQKFSESLPLYFASVVPEQTRLWQSYTHSKEITLEHLPLEGIYPTMGIDRALAAYGAVKSWDSPALVIDGGTALTLTGIEENYKLVGGAILPGLRSQFLALSQTTAVLPDVILPSQLPARWSLNTEEAIASGIVYTILAGIREFIMDWWEDFPEGRVIFTGGDGVWLAKILPSFYPEFVGKIEVDLDLIFKGIWEVVNRTNVLEF
ncbi:pantothenate kinase [Spirulina sp. 06S082]|uniref:pantothenate kinase n=1 Tax=Spirulina sp. 06S082 TaxID=3110248 RepID=UPI002B2037CB|nr:pantothenate kinase [Spirulina sp. 06S082]MEA5470868.1 pantothenate kinase [Spirulina sp. 06S082]